MAGGKEGSFSEIAPGILILALQLLLRGSNREAIASQEEGTDAHEDHRLCMHKGVSTCSRRIAGLSKDLVQACGASPTTPSNSR